MLNTVGKFEGSTGGFIIKSLNEGQENDFTEEGKGPKDRDTTIPDQESSVAEKSVVPERLGAASE